MNDKALQNYRETSPCVCGVWKNKDYTYCWDCLQTYRRTGVKPIKRK